LSAWPSPTKGNGDGSQSMTTCSATGRREDGSKVTVSLPGVAALISWPTTTTRDWKDGSEQPNVERNALLGREVWLTAWSTPRTSDSNTETHEAAMKELSREHAGGGAKLAVEAHLTVSGPARLTVRGEMLTGSSAGTASGGQLDPAHSLWLMGYPLSWGLAAPTLASLGRGCSGRRGTRSSRSKRLSSSKPTSASPAPSKPNDLFG